MGIIIVLLVKYKLHSADISTCMVAGFLWILVKWILNSGMLSWSSLTKEGSHNVMMKKKNVAVYLQDQVNYNELTGGD